MHFVRTKPIREFALRNLYVAWRLEQHLAFCDPLRNPGEGHLRGLALAPRSQNIKVTSGLAAVNSS